MALLTLKDIGKIYVSDNNVAVGIRGVNLSFDRGEFVAVTGKSGSGKSTLLNVISGMDSYEEGELFVEGEPTSHYLQPEWEDYRENYISFIFQDYNIIDSFTVLENVELALMHIEDKGERRRRATELIERVGLTSHLKHKGSKLSGGQKQRTVIARALAKDSPIILADEPTGNLDSQSSREIIELLEKVSHDKLVIVVTHSFEELKDCATRHVRIYDGAVESDTHLKACTPVSPEAVKKKAAASPLGETLKKKVKNGLTLGFAIFKAKPRLSLFLCLLMLIGALGVFFATSVCGKTDWFDKSYMFNHIDGRTVIVRQDGAVMTDGELESLVNEFGASGYLHFDSLLDEGMYNYLSVPTSDGKKGLYSTPIYGKDYGEDIVGRYPEKPSEVFLYLPIYMKPYVGEERIEITKITVESVEYTPVGAKYYYDNNLTSECLFTEEGFRVATAINYLTRMSSYDVKCAVSKNGKDVEFFNVNKVIPSYEIPADKAYLHAPGFADLLNNEGNTLEISYTATYYRYNYSYGEASNSYLFSKTLYDSDLTNTAPTLTDDFSGALLYMGSSLILDIAESVLRESYTQASLFFEDDDAAHSAAKPLREKGYIAVPTDTEYKQSAEVVILNFIFGAITLFIWFIAIVFLAFFIDHCSSRALLAFKGDMAIMRSMGIPVTVIRLGMYARMLISLIPAFVAVILSAILIFTSPRFNERFIYLYAWEYAAIFVGMILLTARTTKKQIKRLFGESVKKSLKGGAAE